MLVLVPLDALEGQGRAVPGHAEQGKPVPCFVRSWSLLQAAPGKLGQNGPHRDIAFVRKRPCRLENPIIDVQRRPHLRNASRLM